MDIKLAYSEHTRSVYAHAVVVQHTFDAVMIASPAN
jgi:hypothetical protein